MQAFYRHRLCAILFLMLFGMCTSNMSWAQDHSEDEDDDHSSSRFSDEPIPLANLPERPKPLLELGEPFLGTGTLSEGFTIPTGAVWQPAFMAFGNVRTAIQAVNLSDTDNNSEGFSEAAFRFDLFGNLYLTASERLLIGFRPFDQGGNFTRYTLSTNNINFGEEDFEEELNFGLRTLFFEGDFGELFPALDWADGKGLDIGLSVGRQPLSFQDGSLINEDAIDIVGLTKANMRIGSFINTRVTALFGWGDIDRTLGDVFFDSAGAGQSLGDSTAILIGLYSETDTRKATIEIDAMVVLADEIQGSGFYGGIGNTRRFGRFSNTWRILGSAPLGDEGLHNSAGALITNQFSWTPYHSYNHVYINAFVGISEFRSAARGPASGGPISNIGVLFSNVGIGRVPAPLGSHADNAVGASAGYQFFFAKTRQQLLVEASGRFDYQDEVFQNDAVGLGARYQIAVQRRGILVFDLIGVYNLDTEITTGVARAEIQIRL